jgi:hypothetical protein
MLRGSSMKIFAASPLVLAFLANGALASDAALTAGSWKSGNGSVLTIASVDQNSGRLEGHFVTTNSGPGCTANGKQQRIAGWYNAISHVITWSVNWDEAGCNAVVAWTGHFDGATGAIATLWTRESVANGEPQTNTGAGKFLPVQK